MTDLRDLLEREASAAGRAAAFLTDEAVAAALAAAARRARELRRDILAANAEDVAAAEGRLDAGMVDRLRLDDGRIDALAEQVEAMAAAEPLARDAAAWTLPNGLRVSE